MGWLGLMMGFIHFGQLQSNHAKQGANTKNPGSNTGDRQ
jgi:hypothetical protein